MSKKKKQQPQLLSSVTEAQLDRIALREAEKDNCLNSYYIGKERYLARALDFKDPACVFVGPKGVGKSAILQMVRLERSVDEKRIIDILPDDLAFHSLANIEATTPILSEGNKHQHLFKSLWDYVLVTEVARREYKSTVNLMRYLTGILKPDERRLRRLLHKTFDDSGGARSFTQRMLDLVSEIELSVSAKELGSGSAKLAIDRPLGAGGSLQILNEIASIAKVLTRPEALRSKYHVLIDDLDLHWRDTEIQNSFIGALFLSLRRLASSPNIKFVVSLRDYIFEAIPIPEKDKVRDSVVRVSWDRQSLRSMIETRIGLIMPSARVCIWTDLFPNGAFDRILEHTNQMPREIIRLSALMLIHAKRAEKRVADNRDLEAAITEFSSERLADLASLHLYAYPGLDRIARRLQGKPPEFHYLVLEDLAIELSLDVAEKTADGHLYSWAGGFDTNPLDLARTLLEVGFLQYKASRRAIPNLYNKNEDMVTKDTWYAIHPMYRSALNPRPIT